MPYIRLACLTAFLLLTMGCARNAQPDPAHEKQTRGPGLPTMTDERDGEVYTIVTIGNQTWMAENLRFQATGSMANPENPIKEYGRVYDWEAAQSSCPPGWHLPTDAEWKELEIELGLPPAEADKMGWRGEHAAKMKSIFGWDGQGQGGNNRSGFNAYPSGFYFDGGFDGLGQSTGFWSAPDQEWIPNPSQPTSPPNAIWVRFLAGPRDGVNRMSARPNGQSMYACRCIKNR